jgi:hypothetical protein
MNYIPFHLHIRTQQQPTYLILYRLNVDNQATKTVMGYFPSFPGKKILK